MVMMLSCKMYADDTVYMNAKTAQLAAAKKMLRWKPWYNLQYSQQR